MVILRTLLQEELRRFGTECMPPCHIPEVVFRSRLVRDKVELPAQGRQTLLLRLQELRIIPPRGVIRAGTHYVQRDRSILAFKRRLQAFQTAQQELRLRTYTIGEVIDTVVCQIENSIGHVTPKVIVSPVYVLGFPHRLLMKLTYVSQWVGKGKGKAIRV